MFNDATFNKLLLIIIAAGIWANVWVNFAYNRDEFDLDAHTWKAVMSTNDILDVIERGQCRNPKLC